MASAPSASCSPETATPALAGQEPPAAVQQPVADITVITTRDDLLLELGQTLGGRAAVQPVDTVGAALAAIAGGKRAQVLLIDARDLTDTRAAVDAVQAATPPTDARKLNDVRAAVDTVHAAAPHCPVLVCIEVSVDHPPGVMLRGSKVFAVLPLPLEERRTQAALEAAIANALANQTAASAAPPPEIGAFRLPPPPADSSDERTPRTGLLVAAAAAAAALAAGAFWYFTHGHGTSVPPAAKPPVGENSAIAPAADTSVVQGKVDELLEKARLAMHERRFTEPAGNNALLYYRSAAAADAGSSEARDGLQRVAGVLAARFEEAIGAGRFDEAALTLANFKAAAPGDGRTAAFEQRLYSGQIGRALSDGNIDRATALVRQAQQSTVAPPEQIARWRADIAHRQEEVRIQRLAGLVDERIRDGNLSDGDDSARAYLQQLQAAAPGNAATQRSARALTSACLHKAREAALAGNRADEDRWLEQARGAGAQATDIAALQKEIGAARQKATRAESDRVLQLAQARLEDGRLTDPAQDSAAWYLTQLQSSDAANAGLAAASHDLAQRLLERARAAALAGKPNDADLAQAKHWGADPADVAAVQQLHPAAQARSAPVDPASLAASLKRLRAAPPDYPASAMAAHQSGSVTLDFTVDTHGEPRDIHVVEATPPQVFDQAAIAAVKHWRYAPMIVDGTAVEVPARTHIRFELPR